MKYPGKTGKSYKREISLIKMRFSGRSAKKPGKSTFSDTKKSPADHPAGVIEQGYKDSNLEMTESESVALPFGDSPMCSTNVIIRDTA